MSAWGTGIKQSDEFMDVYDEFFDRYKDDATAMEVYRAILTEYQEEFSDEDDGPLLYTVYYALAQELVAIVNETTGAQVGNTSRLKIAVIRLKEALAPIYYKLRKLWRK